MDRSKLPSRSLAPRSPRHPTDEGVDWERNLSALRRRKLLLLVIVLAGSGIGVLVGRSMAPTYVSEARFWIDQPVVGAPDMGPIRGARLLHTNAWIELLQSYRVLDAVVLEHALYLAPHGDADPELFLGLGATGELVAGHYVLELDPDGRQLRLRSEAGEILEEVPPGDPIGAAQGFLWTPAPEHLRPGEQARFTIHTVRDAATRLARQLEPAMDPQGQFLRVALRGSDPVRITEILDSVSRRFLEVADELKASNLTERTRILEDQLNAARGQLEATDRALEEFRVASITLPGDAGGMTGDGSASSSRARDAYFDLSLQRDELQRTRAALRRSLEQANASRFPLETLEGIPLVRESGEMIALLEEINDKRAELRALQYRYADDNPEVRLAARDVAFLEAEVVPEAVVRLDEELATREAGLDAQIEAQAGSLLSLPTRSLEEARRSRDMALAQELYTVLHQRYEEARLAEVSRIPDVSVLDAPAVPRVPESNPGPRMMLLAMLGSLGLGVAGVIVRDRADQSVRYPSEITRGLGLNILGAIPRVRRRRGEQSRIAAKEGFRSLSLNLIHSYGSAGPMILTITSPEVGDGKSFITANLAGALARQGKRTVVLDGDTRRGTQHTLMRRDRRPGLTEYLDGEVELEDVLHEVLPGRMDFIPAGARRQAGPELLGSHRMRALITHLKASYEVVLVDTPPLRAGADALLLSTLCGHMLFVLRTGVTHRDIAEANLEALDQLPVRVLGAVLNEISDSGGVFQNYAYLPSYHAADEEPRAPRLAGVGGAPSSAKGAF